MLCSLRASKYYLLTARAFVSTEAAPSATSWSIHQTVGQNEEEIKVNKDGAIESTRHSRHHHLHTPWRSLLSQLESTFLPAGYPSSVSPGYLRFVGWQALHHSAGAANGVLASTFLLYSVGLGAGAIPTAGALSWVLKDGLGQLGTLLFGRAMAHNFDVASRGWYVAASGKLNLAMGLEIATVLAPQWFLPIGAVANAVKGLAWMAGGSSRSAFNVAFAADRNIADITAKATSQTICTSLIGTGVGMAIAASIEQSVGLAFAWYSMLGVLHMWTSVQSAHSVPLSTLNPSRLHLLARLVLDKGISQKLPSPIELARKDGIFPHLRKKDPIFTVGTSLQHLAAQQPELTAALLPLYRNKKYILLPDSHGKMHLVLHEGAQTIDAVSAALQAAAWTQPHDGKNWRCRTHEETQRMRILAINALEWAENMAPSVVVALAAAGWDTQGVVIEARRRRASW